MPGEQVDAYRGAFNLLPSLQLLAGAATIEKQDAPPDQWIQSAFSSDALCETYLKEDDLDGLSLSMADFLGFVDQRKDRMRQRLTTVLGGGQLASE